MPNFLSLFTWNFCLPFKYCLKASNYTVCFILRYLILQYTYNISYPNVCHILSEANYHWCRSSFTKDYMTKKIQDTPTHHGQNLDSCLQFRCGGGGGICPMVWAQSSLTGQNSPRKVGSMRMLQFPHTGVFLSKRSLS